MNRLLSIIIFILLVTGCKNNPVSTDEPPTKPNNSPKASFEIDPASGTTSTTFTVNASGCSDNEDNLSSLQVRWDWNNDGTFDTNYDTKKVETHKFNIPGNYVVKLEVKDSGNLLGTKTKSISVSTSNTLPTAYFDVIPDEGYAGITLFTFDASKSADEEDIIDDLIFNWDFEYNYSTGKIGDISPSTVTGSAIAYSGGTVNLYFTINLESPDWNYASGVLIDIPGAVINSASSQDGYVAAVNADNSSVLFGDLDIDGNGDFIGGEIVTINVDLSSVSFPLVFNWTMYDDGWGTLMCDSDWDGITDSDMEDYCNANEIGPDFFDIVNSVGSDIINDYVKINYMAQHIFEKSGVYTVKLNVMDTDGATNFITRQINVSSGIETFSGTSNSNGEYTFYSNIDNRDVTVEVISDSNTPLSSINVQVVSTQNNLIVFGSDSQGDYYPNVTIVSKDLTKALGKPEVLVVTVIMGAILLGKTLQWLSEDPPQFDLIFDDEAIPKFCVTGDFEDFVNTMSIVTFAAGGVLKLDDAARTALNIADKFLQYIDTGNNLANELLGAGFDRDADYTFCTALVASEYLPVVLIEGVDIAMIPSFELDVNLTGNGTVLKSPNKSYYYAGESVQLTATPSSGWSFDEWQGDLSGDTNPTTITMDSDKSVTAVFTDNNQIINPTLIQPGPMDGQDAFVRYTLWHTGLEEYAGFGDSSLIEFKKNVFNNGNSASIYEGLIKFPLSNISSGTFISSAKMKIFGYATINAASIIPTIVLSKVTSTWNESTVSWNTKPSSTKFSSIDFTNQGIYSWYEVDVTSIVQAWINGEPNYGFEFSIDENETIGKIHSSDHPDSNKRPKLEIKY